MLERDHILLQSQLGGLIKSNSIKTIVMTSPNRGEGKSTLVYRLSLSLAQNKHKVLVIDADLRLPRQHKLFQVMGEHGLSDFLSGGKLSLGDLIIKDTKLGIDLLPNFAECSNAVDLFRSPRWNKIDTSLIGYDIVLIDSPALLALPDALLLAKMADATVVVARWGHSTVADIKSTCSSLEAIGSAVLGIIINQAPARDNSNSYYSGRTLSQRKTKEITGASDPGHVASR
jgi:capsular exopolysaccharide synthesis family protein